MHSTGDFATNPDSATPAVLEHVDLETLLQTAAHLTESQQSATDVYISAVQTLLHKVLSELHAVFQTRRLAASGLQMLLLETTDHQHVMEVCMLWTGKKLGGHELTQVCDVK